MFYGHHHFLTNESGQYVNAAGQVVSRENRVERPFAERYLDVPYIDPLNNALEQFFDPGSFNSYSATIARNAGDTNFYLSIGNQATGGVVGASAGAWGLRRMMQSRQRRSSRFAQ